MHTITRQRSGSTEKLNANDTVASGTEHCAHRPTAARQNHLLHPGIGLTIEHLLSALLNKTSAVVVCLSPLIPLLFAQCMQIVAEDSSVLLFLSFKVFMPVD